MKSSSVLLLAAATGELLVQIQGFVPTGGVLPGAQSSVAAAKRSSLVTPAAKRGFFGLGCPPGHRSGKKSQLRMSSLADDVNADYEELFEANRDWIEFKKAQDPDFFKKSAAEHKPSVLWIGCADSRVPSNEVIGAESGEIFTHRNIANVVMNTDNNLMSGITYAVDVLNVEHIVVCGHTKCGGVQASLSGPKEFSPPLEGWLSHLRMVYRHHRDELDAIEDPDAKLDRLVDLNVIEQCKNVYRTAIVQQRLADNEAEGKPYSTPRIHGCVYDLATGYLKRVNWVTDDMEDPYGMAADETQSEKYNLQKLLANNIKWVESKKAKEPKYFEELGSGHNPSMMWIGCADSRVPSNEIIGADPGEVFTHRNIANVVMQTDQNLQGGLQYAVDALGVEHIVVCGHSNCGGIAASLTPTAFSPPLEGWLHHLANVYRLHAKELDSIKDEKAKLRRLVELNVLEQCNNVAASAIVQAKQRESLAKGAPYPVPRVHGFVYDLETGKLQNLNWQDTITDEYGEFKVRNDYAALGMDDPNEKMYNRKPAGISGGGNPLRRLFGR